MSNMRQFESIGGLWLKEARNGQQFLSAEITLPGGIVVRMNFFVNKFKTDPNSSLPDFVAWMHTDQYNALCDQLLTDETEVKQDEQQYPF